MKKSGFARIPVSRGFIPAILLATALSIISINTTFTAAAEKNSTLFEMIALPPLQDGNSTRVVQLPVGMESPGKWMLFNLAGSLVAAVDAADGDEACPWNGENSRGVPLPAGLYFARFSIDSSIRNGMPAGEWVWNKNPLNPVMESGCGGYWDSAAVRDPSMIDEGDTLKIWYTGYDGQGGAEAIGYAFSVDGGDSWTCHGSPVLEIGTGGAWDSWSVNAPFVMRDGSDYVMYYAGVINGDTSQVGKATSPDGINWTKEPSNPVLPSNASDWDHVIAYKTVLKEGLLYRMWYAAIEFGAGVTFKIGYAESSDGTDWTKHAGNPITGNVTPPAWEPDGMSTLDVARRGEEDDDRLEMWYSGVDMDKDNPGVKLGSAVSADGLDWVKDASNPFLEQGAPGTCDSGDLTAPSAIVYPDRVFLAYSARSDLESGWLETLATAEKTELGTGAAETAPPGRTGLRRTFPNPFNPSITIDFEAPGETRIKLRIFDMTGRLVAPLADGVLPQGRYSVTWDGRNPAGKTVSSGVYICSLEWNGFSERQRLVLLK